MQINLTQGDVIEIVAALACRVLKERGVEKYSVSANGKTGEVTIEIYDSTRFRLVPDKTIILYLAQEKEFLQQGVLSLKKHIRSVISDALDDL